MKAPTEVTDGKELKMRERRERREMGEKIYNFEIYIILLCKYIILMSKRGK